MEFTQNKSIYVFIQVLFLIFKYFQEDSKVSSDEAIENFSKVIHKADDFLAKNTHLFFENGNELILNRIDSRIETADLGMKDCLMNNT